jgi:putative nucleotidyltransferase with HDIG domain
VEVAALARGLARAAGVRPDVAMLAGLVHDVGVLPVLAWADENPTLLNSRDLFERVVADVHTLLGRAILHRWQFPAALVEAVAEHEDWRRDRGPAPDLTDLVVVANLLSLNGGSQPDPEQVPAWRKLAPGEEETRALWEQAQADAGQLRRLLYG